MQWIFSAVSSLHLLLRPINAQWFVVSACIVNRDRGIFLSGRFRSGENPGGGVWRTREDQSCNISVPLCHIADADSFAGTGSIFVQDDVGIRMEVFCNGRVGDLLAELSGREVIELLGRYICSTFSSSRRTLRKEAGLVLKNVANLCRHTYLHVEGTYLAAVDK